MAKLKKILAQQLLNFDAPRADDSFSLAKGPAIRAPLVRTYLDDDDVIADNFAGGGGVSDAFKRALGRSPNHAINHDPEALAMHAANHPETSHHVANVWEVDPVKLLGGRHCAAAWFSPDCKDHSSAKGGKPVEKKIRSLAWVAHRWAMAVKPRFVFLENVPEFMDWGPCIEIDGEMRRDPARKGQTFQRFLRRMRVIYRNVEHRLLRASDYGAPTSRKRFFLICSDEPIVWPAASHGPNCTTPYRTAAECIDWSIPCPSIFMTREEARQYKRETGVQVKRPLSPKTMERIAAGIQRFVLGEQRPFIVPISHGRKGAGRDTRAHSIDVPLTTITSHGRGQHALIAPTLIQSGQGERKGQRPRYLDLHKPLTTVVSCGQRHALVSAFLENGNSLRTTGGYNGGTAANVPMSTVTGQRQKAIVAASLMKFAGTSPGHLRSCSSSMNDSVPTITADGWKIAQVAAFLVRYNGKGGPQNLNVPIGTLDTTDRYGLVTVWIDGEEWIIVDIGMRMLEPRELFRAQGFLDEYQIDPMFNGEPLTRTAQIRMCGNSVPPPLAAAIIGAQPSLTRRRPGRELVPERELRVAA